MSIEEEGVIAYVIDSDPATIAILKELFASVRIEAEYFNVAGDCLARINGKSRGCILADVSTPGVDVATLQRRLHDQGVELPVIFLAYFADVATAVTALKCGAADFLEKPFNGQILLDAVHQAFESSRITAHYKAVRQRLRARFDALTPREWEVLPLMIKGCPNRLIAEKLGISGKTVEVYRARIMRKAGAANLPELLRIAIRIDLLSELAQRTLDRERTSQRCNSHCGHPTDTHLPKRSCLRSAPRHSSTDSAAAFARRRPAR